jgi:GAF domain-containing protein/HAMP domain-containing protein
MTSGQTGLDTVSISGTDRLVSYQPIPDIGYSLAIVVPSRELLAGALAASKEMETAATNTAQLSLVLVAMILAFAVLANVWLGNSLTSPLIALTQTAEEVIGGNLQAQSNVQSRDEIGILSRTLNTMTGNVREMVRSLEQRVRDRTAQLETASKEANRRAEQFEAITRVTRAISSSRNMDQLMPLVTSVISEHFGYYHVGIFLNDEPTRQAYLIAANSEGGRRMLARHHSLRIGEQGIVGYVAARGESRVARSVGQDIVFFNNPDLPATKSEAALPLRTSDRILGVLDMQSTKDDAFTSDDLRILAALADQVVVAIENTRLYETTQRSLAETETLYRQYLQTAWRRVQPDEPAAAYRYAARPLRGSEPARKGSRAESGQPISVPIKLRGEAIGDIVVEPPADADWTQDQMDLIKAVADRVALSAENARLFDETSRRAERERLVTEITSKIRSTNDPKVMMETVQRELRQALGAAQVQIIPQVIRGGTPAEDPRDLSRLREGTGAAAQGKGAKG